MKAADVLAFLGLVVVLMAIAVQLTGRNSPAVRVTVVPVNPATSVSASVLDGT